MAMKYDSLATAWTAPICTSTRQKQWKWDKRRGGGRASSIYCTRWSEENRGARRAHPGGLDEALGDTVEERVAEVQHPVLRLQGAAAHLVRERPRLRLHAAAHLPPSLPPLPLSPLSLAEMLECTSKFEHVCNGSAASVAAYVAVA